jgi:hypothetical protein
VTTDIKEQETSPNGKVMIRMSGSGHCVRALTAQLSGKYEDIARPIPSWLSESATEGKMHEIWIRDDLRKQGFAVWGDQEELILDYPEFYLKGHIDGKCLGNNTGNTELLEIKSMSQFEFQRWQRGGFSEFPSYASQLACYTTATDLDNIRYIVKNRSSGYKDIHLWNDETFKIKDEFARVIDHCNVIVNCLEHNTLPEVEYDGTSLECRRCFYDKLCVRDTTRITDLVTNEKLIEATTKYRNAVKAVEENTAVMNLQRQIFKEQLEAAKLNKLNCNQLVFQVVSVKAKMFYPKKALVSIATEEQLAQVEIKKDAYSYVLVNDKMTEQLPFEFKKDED